jgi:hypothetical protein
MQDLNDMTFLVRVNESIEVLMQRWGHRAPNVGDLNSKRFWYDSPAHPGEYDTQIRLLGFCGKMSYADIFAKLDEMGMEFAQPRALLTLGVLSFDWQVSLQRRKLVTVSFLGPDFNRADGLRDVMWFSIWKDGLYERRELTLGMYRMDDEIDFDRNGETHSFERYFAVVPKQGILSELQSSSQGFVHRLKNWIFA